MVIYIYSPLRNPIHNMVIYIYIAPWGTPYIIWWYIYIYSPLRNPIHNMVIYIYIAPWGTPYIKWWYIYIAPWGTPYIIWWYIYSPLRNPIHNMVIYIYIAPWGTPGVNVAFHITWGWYDFHTQWFNTESLLLMDAEMWGQRNKKLSPRNKPNVASGLKTHIHNQHQKWKRVMKDDRPWCIHAWSFT